MISHYTDNVCFKTTQYCEYKFSFLQFWRGFDSKFNVVRQLSRHKETIGNSGWR